MIRHRDKDPSWRCIETKDIDDDDDDDDDVNDDNDDSDNNDNNVTAHLTGVNVDVESVSLVARKSRRTSNDGTASLNIKT